MSDKLNIRDWRTRMFSRTFSVDMNDPLAMFNLPGSVRRFLLEKKAGQAIQDNGNGSNGHSGAVEGGDGSNGGSEVSKDDNSSNGGGSVSDLEVQSPADTPKEP